MADLVITGIPKGDIPLIWSQVEPLIEKSLENGRGEMWASDVLAFLLTGDMQLWVALDGLSVKAALVTEIVSYPRLKVCRCIYMAGTDMSLWIRGIEIIIAWAKSHGCDEVWGGGRKGWSKVLGWEPTYNLCALKLEN